MKPEKTLERVQSGSRNIRFDDFVRLIEAYGFVLDRISGSHHIFSNPRVPQSISAQPDKNGKAKPYQTHQFMALVKKYSLVLEE